MKNDRDTGIRLLLLVLLLSTVILGVSVWYNQDVMSNIFDARNNTMQACVSNPIQCQ